MLTEDRRMTGLFLNWSVGRLVGWSVFMSGYQYLLRFFNIRVLFSILRHSRYFTILSFNILSNTCSYFHRNLNPKKLIETNFSRLPPNMTMSRIIKKFKLPAETATPGLRPMKSKDAPAIRKLLNECMDKLNFVPAFRS